MRHGAMLLVLLAVGCQRQTGFDSDHDDDTGADGDADGDGDGDGDPDWCDWVGMPCDPPPEEGDEDPCPGLTGIWDAFCFAWSGAPGGFCTRECLPADADNPVDGCDMLEFDVVCMDISAHTADPVDDEDGYGICVEQCVATPTGGDPSCQADYIRCDPLTWAWESQFATCLLPKCQSNADCLVASGPGCAGDGDCSAADGETCSDDGYCVFEASCDATSGRCSWSGMPSAEIGDPCASSWDCGHNGICLTEGEPDGYGKPGYRNGYCSKLGCKAANSAAENGSGSSDPDIDAEFGCGMYGSCQAGYPNGGLCLRRCAPDNSTDAFRCRQAVWDAEVLDANGDYECVDTTEYGFWIPVSGETMMYLIMPYPSCYWYGEMINLRCGDDDFELSVGQCELAYDPPLSGTCRDPGTGEIDTDGWCFDQTAAGPSEGW